MNEEKAWQRLKSMERRTKNYKKNVKQRCIKNIAKGILKRCKIIIYKTGKNGESLIDQNGNKIPKKRSYKNKDGKKVTHVKTRKLLGFEDFKEHFVVIPRSAFKKLKLMVKIVGLIIKINKIKSKPTDLNKIVNIYYNKLQSLESSPSDSDQSDQQQNNMGNDSDMNDDQENSDQDKQVNPDKNKNLDQQNNFSNPNSNFPS